jgi:hypothetical protein
MKSQKFNIVRYKSGYAIKRQNDLLVFSDSLKLIFLYLSVLMANN